MSLESKIQALRKSIPNALRLAANEVQKDVTVLAQSEMELREPIGRTKSGRLKFEAPVKSDTLGIRRPKSGLNQSFYALVENSSIVIGNKQPYARRQEFGGGGIKPRPYLRPALKELLESKAADRIEKIIFNEFVQAWNNG